MVNRSTNLSVFLQSGCLVPLKCLRRFYMTTHPNVQRFNLAKALQHAHSLQQLNLEVGKLLGYTPV